jgi:hypothetical protein
MTSRATAIMMSQILETARNKKKALPADGMIAACSPVGTSAHPAGSSVSRLQQNARRQFSHSASVFLLRK